MARPNSQSFRAFVRELAKHNRSLTLAFLEAVDDIRSTAQLKEVQDAIEAGDPVRLWASLLLDPGFFRPLDLAMEDTFRKGAVWQLGRMPTRGPEGTQLETRFDQRNPRAEAALRRQAAGVITELVEEQRRMVSEVLELNLALGRGPRDTALDLMGRKIGGKRQGGLIGLHSRQARAVQLARSELSDPTTASRFLRRSARNRSYDRTIKKAVREGRALTQAQIERITRGYADRLLQVRGRMIGRTEAHHALNAGRFEGVAQLVQSGRVPAQAIRKTWLATPDPRTRDAHQLMHLQEVQFDEDFVSPLSGARFRYPGDRERGAPPEELINCRCSVRYEIDFAMLARAA